MKLKTYTLGCKVNQYETEYLREGLLGIGYEDAADAERADLCVVNTCTVTAEGDSKSRQVIRRLARDNPTSKIVVMGCYATRAPAEIAKLPNVTEVLTDKRELPDLMGRFGVTDLPTGISGVRSAASSLRESARRLHAAVQLLHHPPRAARTFQPPHGAHSRRSATLGRQWLS